MSEAMDQLQARVSVLEIDNSFLEKCLVNKERDTHVSLYEYESVRAELDLTRS